MADPSIFRPIPVEYQGLQADDAYLDAQQLGRSLVGLGRISNSTLHFYFEGSVSTDARLFRSRFYVGPPKEGSIIYELVALAAVGSLPLYFSLLCEIADLYVPKVISALIFWRIGRRQEFEKVLDELLQISARHEEFAHDIHQGHMMDKAWLQQHITDLARALIPAMRELPDPIGKSCKEMKIGSAEVVAEPVTIDEPTAQVLQSKEELIVADTRQFRGLLLGVDTINGSCRLEIEGGVVRGKITDPALGVAENVYTHALDTQRHVLITAKPVLHEGEIKRLYISDARFDDG